ncbi:hypothetical protein AMATHDRAFT_67626 [Amanita thiersii Skay4041]|uniref:DUF6533 domain-containing protein n=1 Tax=Amanita thiersii Skay4041 TaxID=703135 RepID=A0A2A9NDV9_9AGAR|nr:hypothetical protein AMATHDRAFT_67626 [Amanita thiersii Skay4041]
MNKVQAAQVITPAVVRRVLITNYSDVASIALFCFDYLLTLSLEIKYVWPSRWSIVKVLHVIMRYVPFFSVTFLLLVETPSRSAEACTILMKMYTFGVVTAIFAAEAVLTLRIWAIYSRSRTLGLLLLVIYSGVVLSIFINVGIMLSYTKFAIIPLPSGPTCLVVRANRKLVFIWFVLAVYDAFQCILLGYQAYEAFRHGGKFKLFDVIYKDGIIYYIFMMGMSMLGMIFIMSLPPEYLRLSAGPTHVIHTSLTARVVLHAREFVERQRAGLDWLSVNIPFTTKDIASGAAPAT